MKRAIRKHLGDFLAIAALFVIGIVVSGYILSQQRLRFPFVEEKPISMKVELPDAQAVQPGQGQTVRVAGVRVGEIGKIELENGRAVVEVGIDKKYEGLIRRDATVLLRTRTGLKDMFLEIDPGEGAPLPENGRIGVENTAPDIDADEFLEALDADTRDYLKLLISGAGKGLKGRGSDLRETFRRFGPIHRDLARVTSSIARRRGNLKRLIHNYGSLVNELGRNDDDIVRLVDSSNAVFEAFASQDQNISSFVSKLPGALDETQTALVKVNTLGQRLPPALNALRPPFRKLDTANREVLPLVREATPIVQRQIRPFAREAQPFTRDVGRATRNLNSAAPDITRSFHQLNRLFNMLAYNSNGAEGISEGCERNGTCTRAERARNEGYLYWLGWVAQNTVSIFSTSDGTGVMRRISLGGVNCGIVASLAAGAGVPTQLPGGGIDLPNEAIPNIPLPAPLPTIPTPDRLDNIGDVANFLGALGLCSQG